MPYSTSKVTELAYSYCIQIYLTVFLELAATPILRHHLDLGALTCSGGKKGH